jgi:hypothetical protein
MAEPVEMAEPAEMVAVENEPEKCDERTFRVRFFAVRGESETLFIVAR